MARLNGKKKVNSVNQQVAADFFGVPKEVRDAAKRQYSGKNYTCLLYTSPSPRDMRRSRMPSSA